MEKIKNFIEKNKKYSVDILRIGLALVFLWFGISQLINPESFLGYIPQWLYIQNFSAHTIIISNGIFETVFGFLLLIGLFTRISAFLLALHLLGIMFSLGYNDIAVRDFGLVMATVSLIFFGSGIFSVDNKIVTKH